MQFDRKPFPNYFGIDLSSVSSGDHFTMVKSEYENYFFAVRYVEQQAKVFNVDLWIEESDLQYDIWIVKVGLRTTQNIEDRLYNVIASTGKIGMTKSDIIKKFSNHTAAQLSLCLVRLYDLGVIKRIAVKLQDGTRGRPKQKFISSDAFQQLDTSPETVE